MSNFTLPLRRDDDQTWPFNIKIVDADGREFLTEGRYAYSSKDRSVEELMSARNWRVSEREEVATTLAAQSERIELIVEAVNSFASLQEKVKRLEEENGRLREALKPFSIAAGSVFTRNWNASDVAFELYKNDGHAAARITAGDLFTARSALDGDTNA